MSSTTDQEIQIGETIGGCRIESLLGRGGMGAVYEAQQVSLERRVAVKIHKVSDSADAEESGKLFLKEAKLVAKLNHPNIVQIFDVGHKNDLLYMIMEYVEGVTLKDLLLKQPLFPIDRLHRVAKKVSRGLAAAHKENIVHRDIKPENILLTSHGEVKIADFGAASFLLGEEEEAALIGTPLYMAPEVIRREPSDGRADIYALGLILYAAAAGRHPFRRSETREILKLQLKVDVPPLMEERPELHEEFAALIEKLCAKKPHMRYSAEELMAKLEDQPDWEKPRDWRASPLRHGKPPTPLEPAEPSGRVGEIARALSEADSQKVADKQRKGIEDSQVIDESRRARPRPPAAESDEAEPKTSAPKPSILDAPLVGQRAAPGFDVDRSVPHPSGKTPKSSVGFDQYSPTGSAAPPPPQRPAAPTPTPPPPADPPPQKKSPEAAKAGELCIQARFQMMKKRWDRAGDLFRRALELDPQSDAALLGLARALTEQGEVDSAVKVIQRALSHGSIESSRLLESHHFAELKKNKEFRRLMAEYSI